MSQSRPRLGSWHLKTAKPFFDCPQVANVITTGTTGTPHRSVTDRRTGAVRLTAAGFAAQMDANRRTPSQELLIYFGACHLKLSFAEEAELSTLSYRDPRIKPVATFSFPQRRLSIPRSRTGQDSCRKLELPCLLHPAAGRVPLLAKGILVRVRDGAGLPQLPPGLRCRKTQRAWSVSWLTEMSSGNCRHARAGRTCTATSSFSAGRLKKWPSCTFD